MASALWATRTGWVLRRPSRRCRASRSWGNDWRWSSRKEKVRVVWVWGCLDLSFMFFFEEDEVSWVFFLVEKTHCRMWDFLFRWFWGSKNIDRFPFRFASWPKPSTRRREGGCAAGGGGEGGRRRAVDRLLAGHLGEVGGAKPEGVWREDLGSWGKWVNKGVKVKIFKEVFKSEDGFRVAVC